MELNLTVFGSFLRPYAPQSRHLPVQSAKFPTSPRAEELLDLVDEGRTGRALAVEIVDKSDDHQSRSRQTSSSVRVCSSMPPCATGGNVEHHHRTVALVKVVLPKSGCEMIAKVRRRAISSLPPATHQWALVVSGFLSGPAALAVGERRDHHLSDGNTFSQRENDIYFSSSHGFAIPCGSSNRVRLAPIGDDGDLRHHAPIFVFEDAAVRARRGHQLFLA